MYPCDYTQFFHSLQIIFEQGLHRQTRFRSGRKVHLMLNKKSLYNEIDQKKKLVTGEKRERERQGGWMKIHKITLLASILHP